MDRRGFLKTASVGAAALAVPSVSLLPASAAQALVAPGSLDLVTPGVQPPGAQMLARLPVYKGPWNKISERPFGGFRFALGYIAEGWIWATRCRTCPIP